MCRGPTGGPCPIEVMKPRITGRAKDLIIRGGENIYPREIEEFLYTHPKVADVQVASEAEIREFCNGKIAHFKIPQYIRFVDSFPMTVTGKIQKFRFARKRSGGWDWRAQQRLRRRKSWNASPPARSAKKRPRNCASAALSMTPVLTLAANTDWISIRESWEMMTRALEA